MDNLNAALTGKKLNDLRSDDPTKGSNLIEPTKDEIIAILTALKGGTSHTEIKQNIRRRVYETRQRPATRTVKDSEGKDVKEEYQEDYEHLVSAHGFSFGQIREIDKARLAKISELTPTPDEPIGI